jgi:hypothetical protein
MAGIPRYPPGSNPFGRLGKPRLATELKIDEVLTELARRGVKNDFCARCNAHDWNVDLLEIPAKSALSHGWLPTLPGTGVPGHLSLLAVVCRNCGNTIFHNLEILGIPLRP